MDTVKPHELDASQFWTRYVSQRKPVVLDGHLVDAEWKASAKWDDAYLTKHAGDARIMVEQRDGPRGAYGKGRKVPMAFKDLIQRIQEGDDTLYLTTQKVAVSKRDGHPELWGEPLHRLAHDFTPCPSLMGGLVPQQVNLWMGCARDGASSGLHHDFHDNLYVLMRGHKRFRLWAPALAARMHTSGKVTRIHPNGRIVYEGQGDVRADGSSASEVAFWEARRSAEAAVQAAEAGVAEERKGAAKALEAAEAKLEAALEAQLMHKLSGHRGGSSSDKLGGGSEGGSSDGEESMDLLDGLQDDYMDEDAPDSSQEVDSGDSEGEAAEEKEEEEEEGDPPSFCTGIDLSLPDQQLQVAFPGFPGKAAALEVTLNAGQMLYLPAGWFHEVTSFSPSQPASAMKKQGTQGQTLPASEGHMAVNFWFHPPDNLQATGAAGVARPYKSDYWPALWRTRTEALGILAPARQDATPPTTSRQHDQAAEADQLQQQQQQQEATGKRRRKGQPKKLEPAVGAAGLHAEQQVQAAVEEGGADEGSLVPPGGDADVGDVMAKELHDYCQSPEGAGAFASAFRNFLVEMMLKGGQSEQQKKDHWHRRRLRRKGRRHHRCVRSQPVEDE